MKKKKIRKNGKKSLKKSPVFLIALLNFLIIITILIYIIYLRFIPYETITYDGYAVSGKELVNNLLNSSFDVKENLEALEVKDQDEIYKNIKSYYVGADKTKNINLDYPIYVNDNLALYNLSADTLLYTDTLKPIEGYVGFTLTSGALYNANTLERADYHDYILMKNSDNMYINTKEIKIKTANNDYTIKMNSIINFTDEYITYYSLKDKNFVYGKILDVDMNSKVIIKDYNKEYTYKEFLIGLDIIKEDVKDPVEEEPEEVVEKEESKKGTQKEENKIIIEKEPENVVEEETEESVEEEPVQPDNGNGETKWQKPTVSSTEFVPNVYTATTDISISDPSGAINKAITYIFYKDGEIAFRASALSSGTFKVSQLIPETKYNVIGTYQYKNESGKIIEVKFLDQEFKTLNTKNIKPIDLSFENGQIYSDKIEINNFKITSDITDEAISGVSKAKIIINGTEVSIKTAFLRNALKGKVQNNEITDMIEPNTQYKYEFKFYDTANNEMKLNNNTGATHTSKAIPTVKLKVNTQNVISVKLDITLNNKNNVELFNYRYIMYDKSGEILKQENLTPEIKKLYFEDLSSDSIYTIKIFADYDIEDGNGLQENQEIGSATFITLSISELGSLKLEVDHEDKNLKYDSIKFITKINTTKTDERLIKILTEVNIEIQDENKQTIENINFSDFGDLSTDGVLNEINNLESNTKYNIVITAKAKQGSKEENVEITYTLKSFTTRKKPAKVNIKNLVVTTKLIDFDVIVDDKDGASLDSKYIVELKDENNNVIDSKTINANECTRCTYEELNKGEKYTLKCYAKQYSETNDNVKKDHDIFTEELKTEGLDGDLELTGLIRKNANSKNLIDAQSYNNWYSKCFDVLNTEYITDDNNTTFKINSTARYGKTYNKDTRELTLTSNQCYVYNLAEYAGKEITMSFNARVSNNSIADGIYIQKGKALGENIEKLKGITTSNTAYELTMNVPKDGYLGFYLSKNSSETLMVKDLQVELGDKAAEYQDYGYNLEADIDIDFIDEDYITDNKEANDKYSKYFIKILCNDTCEEYEYEKLSNKVKDNKFYKIDEVNNATTYKVQLLIKVYGREYVLDEISFEYDQERCYEIKSISSVEEFKDIQPYGNYILLEDINLTEATTKSEYTFGNDNIAFYGSIDFNGHTVEKDVYSEKIGKEETSYIFYNIAQSAKLKNLVLDVYLDNVSKRYDINVLDGIYPLFLYNNGNIDNIMVNLKRCNENDKRYVTLMGYQNNATIENFIINFEKTLYGSQYLVGATLYSSGIIQNGYMYGEGIEAIKDIVFYDSRRIAGLVYELQSGGVVQNLYTLAGITINHVSKTDSYAANLVYKVDSGATVRNVYSVKDFDIKKGDEIKKKLLSEEDKEVVNCGPNIFANNGSLQFSYYFTDTIYFEDSSNIKQNKTMLKNCNLQENLLNSNGLEAFNVYKYVENEYYPHLKLNACMPSQKNISFKDEIPNSDDVMDIVSSKIIQEEDFKNLIDSAEMDETYKKELKDTYESKLGELADLNESNKTTEKLLDKGKYETENIHIAQFDVYNPYGLTITKIEIEYINVDIVYQSKGNGMSTVYAILSTPLISFSKYEIKYITGKKISGSEKCVKFGDGNLGKRTIEVSFVKYISTIEDWNALIGDQYDEIEVSNEDDTTSMEKTLRTIQNYKLVSDIDFENKDIEPINKMYGTFDGNGRTLKNIKVKNWLFESVSKTFKNLNIENITISSGEGNCGLIGNITSNNTEIDNINVTNITLESTYIDNATVGNCRIGGIVGYIRGNDITIQNISINNFNVSLNKERAFNNHAIGGIVGYCDNTIKGNVNIQNSYVQGIDIKTENTVITGIGGILGYRWGNNENSKLYIQSCYTEGEIVADTDYLGGIYGRITTEYEATVKQCYSLVNITSSNETGINLGIGGIGGFDGQKTYTINNVYLGNIYTKHDKGKICVGYRNSKNEDFIKGNYGYVNQIINSKIADKNSENVEELLELDDQFNEKLKGVLGKSNYVYSDEQNYYYEGETINEKDGKILPRLLKSSGTNVKLPNQKVNILKCEKITIKSVESDYYSTKDRDVVNADNADSVKITITLSDDIENIADIDIKFENDDLKIVENDNEKKVTYSDKKITVIASPERYYDRYTLTKIIIQTEDQNVKYEYNNRWNISTQFFKTISSTGDWNEFVGGEHKNYAENYKLTNDIDFSGVDMEEIETNVKIGRLIGDTKVRRIILVKSTEESTEESTEKSTSLTFSEENSGFIKEIRKEIKNIWFENFKIKANADRVGVISQLYGKMDTCTFKNIEINGKGKNCIAPIAYCRQYSKVLNVNINEINITGGNNVAGLIAYKNSTGEVNTVYGINLNVIGTGVKVGGIIGESYGGYIKHVNIQKKTDVNEIALDEKNVIEGGCFVGGCVGYSNSYILDIKVKNCSVISTGNTSSNSYLGGCIGYTNAKSVECISSSYNIISGSYHMIGGCIGSVENDSTLKLTNITSIGNKITGNGTEAHYVGGCIGLLKNRMENAKTIDTDVSGANYVGGIVGGDKYNTVDSTAINGAYAKNVTINGNNYVGGISGEQKGTLYGGAVNECTIEGNGDNVGGLVGYYRICNDEEKDSNKISSRTYNLIYSFCLNSTIKGTNNVGGLVGEFIFGNIQYCYVGNTDITANGNNAGGMVGYFNNKDMTGKQYIGKIQHNFIANIIKSEGEIKRKSVMSKNGAGGVIGAINKELEENCVNFNLVVSDVWASDSGGSMGIGNCGKNRFVANYKIETIYIYKYSYIGIQGGRQLVNNLGEGQEEKKAYTIIGSNDLDTNFFTETLKLNNRFNFEDKYFPILNVDTITYWDADNLNVTQEKIAIPEDPVDNQNSGTQLATLNLTSTMLNLNNKLPNVYTYAVDANKINIEFNKTSPYLYFDIKTTDGEVLLKRTVITERVYTFEYDFSTELIITISNLDNWYTETINKDKVQNILDIRDNEYLYILDNNLYSSKREIDGQYLNLYNGKALSTDGNIYDLSTMKVVEKNKEKLKLLDEQMPIAKTNYEDIEIQAFYHCSKVLQEDNFTYKDQQIFIKNGTMYLADGELDSIGNAIIIDSYNGKEYETILGTDGKIYDLLTKINYPSNFKNENIIAMTNNVDNNDNIVLVYYSSGRVYGFNYITGEEIYDNNINKEETNFISYFVNSLNLENALYETNKSSYAEAQKLTEKLEHVSISDALNDITEDDTNGDTKEETTNSSNKNIKEKYITTYDAKTQDYVVYSTSELLVDTSEKTKSENEKINENDELISYYTNVSTSKTKMKDLGIVIISVILLTIAGSLVMMYRKNNKRNK